MQTYLNHYPSIHSQNVEVARHEMISVYGADGFDARTPRFGLLVNYACLPSSGLGFCSYDGAASVSFPESGLIRQRFAIQGRARYRLGKVEAAVGLWTPIIAGHSRLELEFEENYRQLVLRLDGVALERAAKALVGDSSDRKLQFDESAALDPAAMHALREHVFQLARELDVLEAARSPIALTELERSLIVRFLLTHKHNFQDLFGRRVLSGGSGVLQRVEAFIESNWDRPIDITELAEVANVSVRTIFREFERAGKGSPAQFAKRIRLQRAAQMLRTPDAVTTVTGVALRCGFQNVGRFAADYFRAFGELPSEALRRSRSE